ncbi:type II secretion system protein GspJ [Frigoriglobus tundricola]|uniref:Type II secretion system protein J n=1 Tax=Frigoriglobus tundricola TaxID=2774151 RepID=A0A6M5YT61_9BACT|nr:type II secretion system protein GspJ [Frigoriglobus tundricola]QJW97188.1 hypothetical protein FTUN_4753 [Frigoriglobus tundricola]
MIRRTTGRGPSRGRRRGGFTLLEVLLASLIATMVLAALYIGFSLTLQQAQTIRDAVESEDLSRGVFNKFASDFNGTFCPLPPKSGGNTAASGGGTASSTGTGTGTTGTNSTGSTGTGSSSGTSASSTGSSTTSGSSDSSTTATTNTSAFLAAPAFQGGVYCQDPTTLVLFLGRTPESFTRYGDPNTQQPRSDQRQVVYKFVSGSGLYRSEQPWVLASGLTLDLDPGASGSVLLSSEVSGVVFEFTDGTSGEWQTSWDGTVPGPDGVTPLGPPRAVRVTLTLPGAGASGQQSTKTVVQVFVIRTAPGTNTPTMLQAPTAGSSSGGSSSGTGSSGASSSGTGGSGNSTPSAASSGVVTGANASGGATPTGSAGGAGGASGTKTGGSGGTMTGGGGGGGTGSSGTGGTGGGR